MCELVFGATRIIDGKRFEFRSILVECLPKLVELQTGGGFGERILE